MTGISDAPMAGPPLSIGLIGFSPTQEEQIGFALEQRGPAPSGPWRVGSLRHADVWFVNGARAQVLEDGSLRVGAGCAGGRSVRLRLEEVDRPLAFAGPIASPELDVAYCFDIANPASIQALLATMESRWLASGSCLLWMAQVLFSRAEYRGRVYHLVVHGKLLGVIDRLGDVGVLPGITVRDLQSAEWLSRPSSAAFTPPGFVRASFAEVLWKFAVRWPDTLLPDRYLTDRIYLRRPPRVAQRLLDDEHLAIMGALTAAARPFRGLQDATGLDGAHLSRALLPLYLTGAITTTLARVLQLSTRRSASNSLYPSQTSAWPRASAAEREFTVPARLPS